MDISYQPYGKGGSFNWYDGFTFGSKTDIYNPWSIKLATEDLLKGNAIHVNMDEQIVFQQLDYKENAIWSLLFASGYLKAEHHQMDMETGEKNMI